MIWSLRLALAGFIVVAAAAAVRCAMRKDQLLGLLVGFALLFYVAGGLAMAVYLAEVRGRNYMAPDEVAFLAEGGRIVEAWRTGTTYSPAIAGGYPYWNAVFVAAFGASPVPLRLANAVAGAFGVLLAYLLAHRLFADQWTSRTAAILVLLSPSLVIWTVSNLKERPLGVVVTLAILAAVSLLERWRPGGLALFGVSLLALGLLRHYYAAILGWLILPAVAIWPNLALRERIVRFGATALVVGLALQGATGSFLGYGMVHETVVRYVPLAAGPGALVAGERAARGWPRTPSAVGVRDFELGGTVGTGVKAERLSAGAWLRAGSFVLFGGFRPSGEVGRVMALVLAPEWLMTFGLVPLAILGTWRAARVDTWAVLLPALFVASLVVLLSYVHADEWTTFRFRSVYWPVMLILAAGGMGQLRGLLALNVRASRLANASPESHV